VGIAGNEIADEMARNACESASISDQPPFPNDFKITAKQQMKQKWQLKWKNSDTRRMAHSIFPNIATKPWFNEIQEERGVKLAVRSHLNRFQIVDDPLCECQHNYETVDHILWECSRYDRESVVSGLSQLSIDFGTPIRDICAQKNGKL
jgi:hypothetical protein